MIIRHLKVFAPLGLVLIACSPPERRDVPADGGPVIEASSLLGVPLARPELDEAFRVEQERLLQEAKTELEGVDSLIWQGRRLAYLGHYREAIDHYSLALDEYPGEARLWRHRGHRYLTVRRLSLAIADFQRAAELVEGRPDQVEPDGLPNARNDPRSTLGTNIYYHLGLAHYLRGEWAPAIDAYRRCLELSKNPDMQVATTYWLVMALGRAESPGFEDEIASLLEPIGDDLDIVENHAYHSLLLAFKGRRDLAELLDQALAGAPQTLATLGYGIGTWRHIRGTEAGQTTRDAPHPTTSAEEIWRHILENGAWPSFGYLAAEAEIARLGEAAP